MRLKEPIAKLVVRDLIIGDGLKAELAEARKVIGLLRSKSSTQDSIVFNYKTQLENLSSILYTKDEQFNIQQKLSKDLQLALKKEKIKNKIFSIGAPVLIIGALLIK